MKYTTEQLDWIIALCEQLKGGGELENNYTAEGWRKTTSFPRPDDDPSCWRTVPAKREPVSIWAYPVKPGQLPDVRGSDGGGYLTCAPLNPDAIEFREVLPGEDDELVRLREEVEALRVYLKDGFGAQLVRREEDDG